MKRMPKLKLLLTKDRVKTGIAITAGALVRGDRSPDEEYRDLFRAVQANQIFADSKEFADLVPRKRAHAILDEYKVVRDDPQFDLREFITRHFYEFTPHGKRIIRNGLPIDEHIDQLWEVMKRRNRRNRGSLLTLPYEYIVPGGRFNEQFYWDSYFVMLGLATSGRWAEIENMVKNYTFMIRKYGFIPTANRSYFLSRSQPPFFVQMVRLLARHSGKQVYLTYLPYLLAEYHFWMKGTSRLDKREFHSYRRVVKLDDGVLLNRYYDNRQTPRPESLREDLNTSTLSPEREPEKLYLHLRAAAESGWDFSSRWFDDPTDIKSIHTADILPVDLNSLLYLMEQTITEAYKILRQPLLVKRFNDLAQRRKKALRELFWDADKNIFSDYNFHRREKTGKATLAMVFPLYVGAADREQADHVAHFIENNFLKPGGLVTTLKTSGQQWDAPNGWAPLEWVAVQGLKNYGYEELAQEITHRWLERNELVYESSNRLVEKYNVIDTAGLGGGGEYLLQDGFGWTNGVYLALKNNLPTDALSPAQ